MRTSSLFKGKLLIIVPLILLLALVAACKGDAGPAGLLETRDRQEPRDWQVLKDRRALLDLKGRQEPLEQREAEQSLSPLQPRYLRHRH